MKAFMLLPLSMTWASVQGATNMGPSSHHRRHLMKESSCTLVEMCVSKGVNEEDEHSWVCELSKEESSIIHADFVDIDHSNPDVANIIAHAKSGETVLKFQEAVVSTEEGREPLIHFTESALVQETTLVENISASVTGGVSFISIEERTRNADETPSTFGTLTALMVRVTDRNGRVNDRNTTQLHDNLYQGVSLATQTEACSHGQLTIEPFAGTMPSGLQITDGVVELTADEFDITVGKGTDGVTGPIFRAAEQAFGAGYREMVDLMLFCLPSTGRFLAFAYNGRMFSWYAGSMCSSPTAQLHEVGHNYGLGHSGRIDGDGAKRKYGDITGVMGTSGSNENDKTCYNPHKSWFLGWYQDQTISIDPLDGIGTREILLNGVDDYGKNNEAIVSLRLTTPASQEQDYYVGLNYAEGINKNTRDEKNKITVAYASKGSPGQSWRVAALLPGEWHEIKDFDGGGSTVTVVYYGRTNAGDATVQIIDGPMPPPPSEDDCGSRVTVAIKTDSFPEDVSWYIFETDGTTRRHIASKTSFDERWTEYSTTVCIPNKIDDQEYVFEILDLEGDGLCCTQGKRGNGFEVYDNQGNVWANYLNVKYKYRVSTHSIIVPGSPTESPSDSPTVSQSKSPSESPSDSPTVSQSKSPSESPSDSPTVSQSKSPSESPSDSPTVSQSKSPSESPSDSPTVWQSKSPSESPSDSPTVSQSEPPSELPVEPTQAPVDQTPSDCKDAGRRTKFVVRKKKKGRKKTCVKLFKAGVSERKKKKICNSIVNKTDEKVQDICKKSCGEVGLGECQFLQSKAQQNNIFT